MWEAPTSGMRRVGWVGPTSVMSRVVRKGPTIAELSCLRLVGFPKGIKSWQQ